MLKQQKDLRKSILANVHGAEERNELGSARAAMEDGSENGDVLRRVTTLNKFEILKQLKEADEIAKHIESDERKKVLEDMNRQGDAAVKMIVMPKYQLDKRLKVMKEVDAPSDKLFIGLGWDEDDKTKRKHYRQYIADELEFNKEVFSSPSPFNSFDIKRGQARGASGGLFSTKKSNPAGKIKKVGYFKGII